MTPSISDKDIPPTTPTTPKTPSISDKDIPTTDSKTNEPEPNTPVYTPKPYKPTNPEALTPAPITTPILGKVIGPFVSISKRLPKPVAKVMPYSLLTLLLALSALYAYSSHLESKRRKAIQALTTRFKNLLSARATYLQITSHYINTPITKMQGTLELLSMGLSSTSSSTSSGSVSSTISNSSTSSSTSSGSSSSSSNSTQSSNPKANQAPGSQISPDSNSTNNSNSNYLNNSNPNSDYSTKPIVTGKQIGRAHV